jgi:hypothetical protein
MHRDDLECVIGNLICDLLHFADQQGFDSQAILEHGNTHFKSELLLDELMAAGRAALFLCPGRAWIIRLPARSAPGKGITGLCRSSGPCFTCFASRDSPTNVRPDG